MLKDKGIKNLLSQLRSNVENSAKQAPEIIKNSKLISCGPTDRAKGVQEEQKV